MLIINLFGGPGSGKSTLALLVTGFLKTRHPTLTVECPGEVAKEVVYDGALKALDAQLYISGRQWWQVARCAGHADIVVTDSPILMSPVYGEECVPPMPASFHDVCKFHHDTFPSLNFFVQRAHAFEDRARAHDEAQSDRLSQRIQDRLDVCRIPYATTHSSEMQAEGIAKIAARRAQELKEPR